MTLTAHADTYALDLIVPPKILLHRICRMQENNITQNWEPQL